MVFKDRVSAWVVRPFSPVKPEQLRGPLSPHFARLGTTGGCDDVLSSLSVLMSPKARLDIAAPSRRGVFARPSRAAITTVVEQLRALGPTADCVGSDRRDGNPLTERPRHRRVARGRRQSSSGARLRQSQWAVGENRCARRSGAGAVRRGHPPAAAAAAGCGGSRLGRVRGPTPATRRDADGREESPAECSVTDPQRVCGRISPGSSGSCSHTNTDVAEAIRESPAWREKDELLQSVPGVGPVLTSTL